MKVKQEILSSAGLTLILLLMVSFCSPGATQDKLSGTTEAQINEAAEQLVKDGKTSGLAIGVMKDGKMFFAKGYGMANLEDGVPVTPETVFRIGSLTKQFTAASIMLLVEQGKLSVEDKLVQSFPDFPRANKVSIRQLLNHTSGIHNFNGSSSFMKTEVRLDKTTDELVNYIAQQKPLYDFDPGTKWEYSNSGYSLLGAIVEKVSGMSLRDFMKRNLFDKATLEHTAIDEDSEVVPHRAEGYEPVPNQPGMFQKPAYISITLPSGGGALRSTIEDLAKWQYDLFHGKIVSPQSFKEMITPGRFNNGEITSTTILMDHDRSNASDSTSANKVPHGDYYGYGLFLQDFHGYSKISHPGGIPGFNAIMSTFPQFDISVVILANSASSGIDVLEQTVSSIILEESPDSSLKQ